jgi:hypothetical protein
MAYQLSWSSLVVSLSLALAGGGEAAHAAQAPDLAVRLSLEKTDFAAGEKMPVRVLITNVSAAPITFLQTLAPEGWLIQLSIADARGRAVYTSRKVKIEMTAALLERKVTLERDYVWGITFTLEKTPPPGEYVIQGSLSTAILGGFKDLGIPIGMWSAPPVRFRIEPR